MRHGADKVVRRYDPAKSQWKCTDTGKTCFDNQRVPFKFEGTSKFKGDSLRKHTKTGFDPLSGFVPLPLALTQRQRNAKIKEHVSNIFPTRVIVEYSEETITIQAVREWLIVEMVTIPGPACEPQADVRERTSARQTSMTDSIANGGAHYPPSS